tara:strand:- start:177 stop:365 length:189 start_codon:yes stop_codon:yes gene_type:complete
MAYNGLTVVTTVVDEDMSSHCIPAYPEYTTSTDFNKAFYTARQASNNALAEGTFTLEEVDSE